MKLKLFNIHNGCDADIHADVLVIADTETHAFIIAHNMFKQEAEIAGYPPQFGKGLQVIELCQDTGVEWSQDQLNVKRRHVNRFG